MNVFCNSNCSIDGEYKSQNTVEMITIQSAYPTSTYIILPIVTIYCGVYLNLSNHYILRPKIEPFLQKLSLSSSLAIEIIVDILSNLSFITYACSSSFLLQPSDQPIRMIQIYTIYWATICLVIIMYIRVPATTSISKVIFCKNGFMLLLSFVNLIYHYFSNTTLITLPTIFMGLYAINILVTAYEDKFITIVFELLSIQEPPTPQPKQKMISHLPTIEYLSANYPITNQEIDEKLELMRERGTIRYSPNFNKIHKPVLNKIDTKIIAREKLMRISLCVHLSMLKKQQQEINAVRQYYGLMNGTISDKGVIKPKQVGRDQNTYLNNRNKDKNELASKAKKDHPSKMLNSGGHETTDMKLMENGNEAQEQPIHIESAGGLQSESLMYYLFPIRIFEFSKVMSTVFRFGVLLGYCQTVMNTLYYGRFAQLALAGLFLPIIPRVSLMQFINTLSLATIWKFAVFGLFALISMTTSATDDSSIITLNFALSSYQQYISVLGVVVVCIGLGATLLDRNIWKIMILVFVVSGGLMGWITYVSIVKSNSNTNTN